MNMTLIVCGLVVVMAGGLIGFALEVGKSGAPPAIYWLLGCLGGVGGWTLMLYGAGMIR